MSFSLAGPGWDPSLRHHSADPRPPLTSCPQPHPVRPHWGGQLLCSGRPIGGRRQEKGWGRLTARCHYQAAGGLLHDRFNQPGESHHGKVCDGSQGGEEQKVLQVVKLKCDFERLIFLFSLSDDVFSKCIPILCTCSIQLNFLTIPNEMVNRYHMFLTKQTQIKIKFLYFNVGVKPHRWVTLVLGMDSLKFWSLRKWTTQRLEK